MQYQWNISLGMNTSNFIPVVTKKWSSQPGIRPEKSDIADGIAEMGDNSSIYQFKTNFLPKNLLEEKKNWFLAIITLKLMFLVEICVKPMQIHENSTNF